MSSGPAAPLTPRETADTPFHFASAPDQRYFAGFARYICTNPYVIFGIDRSHGFRAMGRPGAGAAKWLADALKPVSLEDLDAGLAAIANPQSLGEHALILGDDDIYLELRRDGATLEVDVCDDIDDQQFTLREIRAVLRDCRQARLLAAQPD